MITNNAAAVLLFPFCIETARLYEVNEMPFLMALMQEGVLALSAGPTVIRLLPPLVITREELGEVVEKLLKVLAD